MRLDKVADGFCGSVRIGLTSLLVSESYPAGSLPSSLSGIDQVDTWWICDSDVRRNSTGILRLNFCPSLSRLVSGCKLAVKKTSDSAMRLYINGEDYGIAATNINKVNI